VDVLTTEGENGTEGHTDMCPDTKTVTVKNCNIAAQITSTDFDACNGTISITAKQIFTNQYAKGKWTLTKQPAEQSGKVELNGTGVAVSGSVDANKSNILNISNMNASGSYTFRWDVQYQEGNAAAQCPLSAEFTVKNNSLTTKADFKGPEAEVEVCGDTYTLTATNHGEGYSGVWTGANGEALTVGDANGTGFRISNSTLSSAVVYGIPEDGMDIKWTVTKMTTRVKMDANNQPEVDGNGDPIMETVPTTCSASDVLSLTNVKGKATASLSTNPICNGEGTLNASNTISNVVSGKWEKASPTQAGKFVYGGNSYDNLVVTTANSGAASIVYTGIPTGQSVSVKWTISKTINGEECSVSTDPIELVNNGFDISINGGSSKHIC
jgi:hypothetical protein